MAENEKLDLGYCNSGRWRKWRDSFRAGRSTKELAEEGYRALVRTWKNLQRLFENDNGNRGSGSWNVTATNGLP